MEKTEVTPVGEIATVKTKHRFSRQSLKLNPHIKKSSEELTAILYKENLFLWERLEKCQELYEKQLQDKTEDMKFLKDCSNDKDTTILHLLAENEKLLKRLQTAGNCKNCHPSEDARDHSLKVNIDILERSIYSAIGAFRESISARCNSSNDNWSDKMAKESANSAVPLVLIPSSGSATAQVSSAALIPSGPRVLLMSDTASGSTVSDDQKPTGSAISPPSYAGKPTGPPVLPTSDAVEPAPR